MTESKQVKALLEEVQDRNNSLRSPLILTKMDLLLLQWCYWMLPMVRISL